MHRLTSWGFLVCGRARIPADKVTSIGRNTTCPACRARRAAHQKSAKARAGALGLL